MTDSTAPRCYPVSHRQDRYEHALYIGKLAHAAEMLAESCPNLHLAGAPPIHFLLEQIVHEVGLLQEELSD